MALIVTCKDLTSAIDFLHRITLAMENGKIADWEKVGTNQFRNTKKELRETACFRPTIKENKLYFDLVAPDNTPVSVSRSIYEEYHAVFYDVLVRLSWTYFFTVERSPDEIEDKDARTAENS